jgi:hypothetical protein
MISSGHLGSTGRAVNNSEAAVVSNQPPALSLHTRESAIDSELKKGAKTNMINVRIYHYSINSAIILNTC